MRRAVERWGNARSTDGAGHWWNAGRREETEAGGTGERNPESAGLLGGGAAQPGVGGWAGGCEPRLPLPSPAVRRGAAAAAAKEEGLPSTGRVKAPCNRSAGAVGGPAGAREAASGGAAPLDGASRRGAGERGTGHRGESRGFRGPRGWSRDASSWAALL